MKKLIKLLYNYYCRVLSKPTNILCTLTILKARRERYKKILFSLSERLNTNEMKSLFADINFQIIKEEIGKIGNIILDLQPEKILLEVTYEKSVLLTAVINSEKKHHLYVELFFESEKDTEVILNIYESRHQILSFGGSLKEVATEIKIHYQNDEYNIKETSYYTKGT